MYCKKVHFTILFIRIKVNLCLMWIIIGIRLYSVFISKTEKSTWYGINTQQGGGLKVPCNSPLGLNLCKKFLLIVLKFFGEKKIVTRDPN